MALQAIKKRLFPKGIRRAADNWKRQCFQRVTQKDLVRAIRRMGMPDGAWICIHSQLSGLGYLVGGPRIILDALREAVPGCTLLMPTFPFAGTAEEFIAGDPLFDPVRTPSRSGMLSEVLRLYPGAKRSLHPTHPCVAVGPDADVLIDGSEHAVTPFGPDSSYGRYARSPKAWQFLVHTNATSIVHEFQEAAEMPNLFLPDLYTARGLDRAGQEQRYSLKIHFPLLPLFVATPEYVWFPDYALPFPAAKRNHLVNRMKDKAAAEAIIRRHDELHRAGVFREAKIRESQLLAVEVAPWRARVCEEVRESIARFPERYDVAALREAKSRKELITT